MSADGGVDASSAVDDQVVDHIAKPVKNWRRWLAGTAVLVAVAAVAGLVFELLDGGTTGGSGAPPLYGRVLRVPERTVSPTLSGTTLTGEHLDIAGLRGHVVVVNVWGSWCVPCRQEAPDLARLSKETAAEGVRFVGVDIRDDRAAAMAFEAEFGITYPSVFDGDENATLGFRPWLPIATPTTYVLDARGRIAAEFFGRTRYADLQPVVQQIVELG